VEAKKENPAKRIFFALFYKLKINKIEKNKSINNFFQADFID